MDNGRDGGVIRQFDVIADLPDTWDHSQHYQGVLLKGYRIHGTALDVGCGSGELTRKLKSISETVIGIDVSEKMIETAIARNSDEGITYLKTDVENFLRSTNMQFDLIVCVAALHHMDEEKVLGLMKEALKENGRIAILDLYRQETPAEFILSFLAVLVNPIMMLAKRGRLTITKEEREAWKDHSRYDSYRTIREMKSIAKRCLGNVDIRRHLFWRYSLIYEKSSIQIDR